MKRQSEAIERFRRLEDAAIPEWVDFAAVTGLSTEAKERLSNLRPRSLGSGSQDARNYSGRSLAVGGAHQSAAAREVRSPSIPVVSRETSRDPRCQSAPAQIAKAVRTLVEAFLHTIPDQLATLTSADRIETVGRRLALWGSRMNLTAHPDDPEEIAFHVSTA